jgi:hypothetical protein
MRIHRQMLDMGGAGVEVLESVLGSSIEEAFTIYAGRTASQEGSSTEELGWNADGAQGLRALRARDQLGAAAA